jgi:hypothetical protein
MPIFYPTAGRTDDLYKMHLVVNEKWIFHQLLTFEPSTNGLRTVQWQSLVTLVKQCYTSDVATAAQRVSKALREQPYYRSGTVIDIYCVNVVVNN